MYLQSTLKRSFMLQTSLPATTHGPGPAPRTGRTYSAYGTGCPVVASVMSRVQGLPWVWGPGVEGDVFDQEADESLLVQREWWSHMQRRVQVKLRGGRVMEME